MNKSTPLIIKGIRIDPSILQRERIERCDFQECGAACCSGGVWLDVDLRGEILERSMAISATLA